MLPWSEMDSLQLETGHIKEALVALNRAGYLTINSQPRVNGAPSTDPNVGWGGPNGCAGVWGQSFSLLYVHLPLAQTNARFGAGKLSC